MIYLEEKNEVPSSYSSSKTESKVFYDPVVVQDFPIRGKKVFLSVRRCRWVFLETGENISRDWKQVPKALE